MPAPGFQYSAALVDLSPRIVASSAVVASPAAAAETIIASVTIPGGISYASGVLVVGWAAWTVGTDGTNSTLRVRQTGTSGTIITATGAIADAATVLESRSVVGFDASPAAGQVYKLTLLVTLGSAPSTVSAVCLAAIAV